MEALSGAEHAGDLEPRYGARVKSVRRADGRALVMRLLPAGHVQEAAQGGHCGAQNIAADNIGICKRNSPCV